MKLTEKTQTALYGVLVVAAGGLSAASIQWHPEVLNVPAWVGYSACLAFVFVGLSVIAQAYAHRRTAACLAVAFLAALALTAIWVAFGPGSRECSVSLASWVGSYVGMGSDWVCRGVFGFGAVVGTIVLLWSAWRALRQQPT